MDTLEPKKHGRRKRKLDWQKLKHHVEEYPDALLRERAAAFGVRISSIEYGLAEMEVSHKKTLRYAERDYEERIAYLRKLREIVSERGSQDIVYRSLCKSMNFCVIGMV